MDEIVKKQLEAESLRAQLIQQVQKEYQDTTVSVTLLNNFFECPWKWYFRNLLQLPEPQNDSLDFGNLIHSAVDQILKMGKKPTAKDLENFVVGDKVALKIISKWAENRLPEISLNVFSTYPERKLNFSSPTLLGYCGISITTSSAFKA